MRSATKTDSNDRIAVAILSAACLLLAAIDHLIPKPVPFVRIGLANLPILIALRLFGIRQIVAIAALKIVGQGLITGMLFSYVFLLSAGVSRIRMAKIDRQRRIPRQLRKARWRSRIDRRVLSRRDRSVPRPAFRRNPLPRYVQIAPGI